jgi:hypothetical protein
MSRAEASQLVWAASTLGQRARVVRRHVHGRGWTFSTVVDGFESRDQAVTTAQLLTAHAGVSVSVFADGAAGVSGVQLPMANRTFQKPSPQPMTLGDAVFRYRRTTDTGIDAVHTYARFGLREAAEITSADGGDAKPVHPDLLRRFSPEGVFAPIYRVGVLLHGGLGDRLVEIGTSPEGIPLMRDPAAPEAVYSFDTFGRLRSVVVSVGGYAVIQRFEEYRERAPGVVLPWHLERLEGGRTVETIHVLQLSTDPGFTDSTFPP